MKNFSPKKLPSHKLKLLMQLKCLRYFSTGMDEKDIAKTMNLPLGEVEGMLRAAGVK